MSIDWAKPITTIDGAPARLLGKLAQGAYIVAVAEKQKPFATTANERDARVDDDGRLIDLNAAPLTGDQFIINVQRKLEIRTAWINISEASHGPCYVGRGYHTKKEADVMRPADFVDCIKIEWRQAVK